MSDVPGFEALEGVGIAERDKPPFVRLPDPAAMFERRAQRFAALAPGHQLEAYLQFLAGVAQAQRQLAAELPAPALPARSELRMRAANAMPPVPREDLADEPVAMAALERLTGMLDGVAMPALAREALGRVAAMDEAGRRLLFAGVLADAIPVEALAEHVFAAAALQVAAAARSAQLDAALPQPVADGVCPCCGGPPVTSAIVADLEVDGVRYVQCSLCATQWNHVRVKCVSCGSTKGITYQAIEGIADTIKAETCGECRTYVKILDRRKDPTLEPVADDVASLGLDLLVTEAGWKRAGVNPFLLGY